ncbi:MAG: hypothetical protein KIT15_12430 [Xanthobacteraceae bacterium]|nr:hypothetical protein [Xanthobacteraceae bacterium]
MINLGPKLSICALVKEFAKLVASGEVEIYNEFSLQHELGLYLRYAKPEWKIRFERNVSSFFGTGSHFTKREIDISISTADGKLVYAIELKFPRNGQYPEQMFGFCKDIAFAEELHQAGFQNAAFIVFADDPLFYSGTVDGIYQYFRSLNVLTGRVEKPTGKRDQEVVLRGAYHVQWRPVVGQLMYAVVEIDTVLSGPVQSITD